MQNIRLVEGITTKLLNLKQESNNCNHPLYALKYKFELYLAVNITYKCKFDDKYTDIQCKIDI